MNKEKNTKGIYNFVYIFIKTGDVDGAGTDSNIHCHFLEDEKTICSFTVLENQDNTTFERNNITYAYLGDYFRDEFLQDLFDANKVKVRIKKVTDDRPKWYPEYIRLELREYININPPEIPNPNPSPGRPEPYPHPRLLTHNIIGYVKKSIVFDFNTWVEPGKTYSFSISKDGKKLMSNESFVSTLVQPT